MRLGWLARGRTPACAKASSKASGPTHTIVQVDPELIQRLQRHADSGDFASRVILILDELLDKFAFSGNANDIIAQCEGLFAAGVDRIELGTPHGVSVAATGIDIIGTQVLPALRTWVG